MTIRRVWIEEGCTFCTMCEEIAPAIFAVDQQWELCSVLDTARRDGRVSDNRVERSLLIRDFGELYADQIVEARDACPAGVIHCEFGDEAEAA